MKHTRIFTAEFLQARLPLVQTELDGTRVPARPMGHTRFWYRLKAAWLVFQGKADVIKWYKQ